MACQALPAVSFSDACNPDVYASEIDTLYVANADAADIGDWTDPLDWAALLSQSVTTTGNEIRKLTVIGDKPAAQPINASVSKRRTVRVDAVHTINFEIDDVTAANYTAVLGWQAGVRLKLWYKTRGGYLFGGNGGVIVDVNINPVYGRGDEIEKFIGTATWNSKQDPLRIASPI